MLVANTSASDTIRSQGQGWNASGLKVLVPSLDKWDGYVTKKKKAAPGIKSLSDKRCGSIHSDDLLWEIRERPKIPSAKSRWGMTCFETWTA